MINIKFLSLLFFLFACSAKPATEQNDSSISGKVIAVKDGDTIEIIYEGKPVTIRLAHIDCPEIRKSQPFGKEAKKFTSDKCFGEVVTILNEGKYDRYKRLIGVVINAQGENVNLALVNAGLAWHFKKYSADTVYANAEIAARQRGVGIWAAEDPVAPWDWRKQ